MLNILMEVIQIKPKINKIKSFKCFFFLHMPISPINKKVQNSNNIKYIYASSQNKKLSHVTKFRQLEYFKYGLILQIFF